MFSWRPIFDQTIFGIAVRENVDMNYNSVVQCDEISAVNLDKPFSCHRLNNVINS